MAGMALLLVLRKEWPLSRSYALLLGLNVFQLSYLLCRSLWGPYYVASFTSSALSCAPILLFLIYASFFIESGVRKSLTALALGIIIAGCIQILLAFTPSLASLAIASTLLPLSTLLLVTADRRRAASLLEASEDKKEKEGDKDEGDAEDEKGTGQEDAEGKNRNGEDEDDEEKNAEGEKDNSDERNRKSKPERRKRSLSHAEFGEYCASLVLMNALVVLLYSLGRAQQAESQSILPGIGVLLCGILLLNVLVRFEPTDVLETLRIVVLPLLLAFVYISTALGGHTLSISITSIAGSAFHSALILFVWAVPKLSNSAHDAFLSVCITYLCFRIGGAIGTLGGFVSQHTNSPVFMFIVVGCCFVGLLLLIVKSYYRLLTPKIATLRREKDEPSTSHESMNSGQTFQAACAKVAEEFGLSCRETEVVAFLARGRNAKHIANKLIISQNTARTHVNHIYRKMGISSQQTLMDMVESAQGQIESAQKESDTDDGA